MINIRMHKFFVYNNLAFFIYDDDSHRIDLECIAQNETAYAWEMDIYAQSEETRHLKFPTYAKAERLLRNEGIL